MVAQEAPTLKIITIALAGVMMVALMVLLLKPPAPESAAPVRLEASDQAFGKNCVEGVSNPPPPGRCRAGPTSPDGETEASGLARK